MLNRLRRRLGLGILAAVIAVPLVGLAQEPGRPPVTVFAAASLKNALDEVGAAFTATGGTPVRFSYAASSAIARQIEQGAPADVFVSADSDWMDYLQKRNLIVATSRRDILANRLALICAVDSRIQLKIARGMPLAAALGGGRLAIAGPEVPAGMYGRASLASLGVLDSVADKLAPAENVRAALAFVAQGAAPLGIVYDTDARVEPKVRIVGLFPDSSHPPIVYPAAQVTASHNSQAAGFLDFLKNSKAVAVFRKYGFTVVR